LNALVVGIGSALSSTIVRSPLNANAKLALMFVRDNWQYALAISIAVATIVIVVVAGASTRTAKKAPVTQRIATLTRPTYWQSLNAADLPVRDK